MCAMTQEKTSKRGENSQRGMIIVCNVPGKDDKTRRESRERYDICVQCPRRRRQNGGENSQRGMIIVYNVPGKDNTTTTAQFVVRLPNMKFLLDVLFVFQNRRENSDRDRIIVCNVPGEGDTTTTAQFTVRLPNMKLFLDV